MSLPKLQTTSSSRLSKLRTLALRESLECELSGTVEFRLACARAPEGRGRVVEHDRALPVRARPAARIHSEQLYEKGFHDAPAEIHGRAPEGDIITKDVAESLIGRYLHTPFAHPTLRGQFRSAGGKAIEPDFDTEPFAM